jgi:hypothetical protein
MGRCRGKHGHQAKDVNTEFHEEHLRSDIYDRIYQAERRRLCKRYVR